MNADSIELSVKHLFGDVWSRPQLSLRVREMVTLAVLAAGGWERHLDLQRFCAGHLSV